MRPTGFADCRQSSGRNQVKRESGLSTARKKILANGVTWQTGPEEWSPQSVPRADEQKEICKAKISAFGFLRHLKTNWTHIARARKQRACRAILSRASLGRKA